MKETSTNAPFHGVGRRKSAVARVWMRPGSGSFIVNGLEVDTYFDTDDQRAATRKALLLLGCEKNFDIKVNVVGGGSRGQSDAVKLGIARALLKSNEAFRAELKKNGLLTVDARVKERKKYGQRGARAKFQFVKR